MITVDKTLHKEIILKNMYTHTCTGTCMGSGLNEFWECYIVTWYMTNIRPLVLTLTFCTCGDKLLNICLSNKISNRRNMYALLPLNHVKGNKGRGCKLLSYVRSLTNQLKCMYDQPWFFLVEVNLVSMCNSNFTSQKTYSLLRFYM